MRTRPKLGYVLANADLQITQCNVVLRAWFGLDESTWVGQPLLDMWPELIGREGELMATEIATAMAPLCIHQIQRTLPDGRERYYDLQLEGMAQPDGRHIWLVTLNDVTHEAEQEQRLSQRGNELHLLSSRLSTANEQLTFLLKRFVPAPVAETLIQSRHLPPLGGQKNAIATILFADMRNFTGMAETLEPEEVFDVLNIYLEVVADAILHHGGTIIQIVGDLVMATFNVPDAQPDHVQRAAEAAVAIQHNLARFVRANGREVPAVQFGIGVHTGIVMTGYLGVRDRYRYAVVSDTTNVAFHLCSKARGGQIIISQTTLAGLETAVAPTYLGEVTLKARRQALPIYELQVAEAAS